MFLLSFPHLRLDLLTISFKAKYEVGISKLIIYCFF
jgi:hypothetical protein